MAESVMLSATEKLERLLVEKSEFLEGAEAKVRGLIRDMNSTVLTLNQLEAWGIHQYVMSVAEIAHDANFSIDTFISNVEISHLNNFTEEIQSIRNRIKAVETDITNYYQSPEAEALMDIYMRWQTVAQPDVEEEDTAGLKGEVKLLLEKAIFEKTEELSTLYIMGMGGIGKTALASVLYNHAQVVVQFEIRAWLHVTNESPSKHMLIELIQQLRMEGEPEEEAADLVLLSFDILRERVFRHLEGRRYFIVLDNVWSHEHLDVVLGAFPREGMFISLSFIAHT